MYVCICTHGYNSLNTYTAHQLNKLRNRHWQKQSTQLTNSCRTILLVMSDKSGEDSCCCGFDGGMGGVGCCGRGCFSPFLLTACSKEDIFSLLTSALQAISLCEASSPHSTTASVGTSCDEGLPWSQVCTQGTHKR